MNPRKFRLGTTSFIYPDHIVPNVEKLGRHFDEIELLIFESLPDEALPPEKDIRTLVSLSRTLDVGYNVHLPLDVSLTSPDDARQQQAVERILRVMDLTEPLGASSYTLHLDFTGPDTSPDNVKAWQERAACGLSRLGDRGVDFGQISVETLDFPFEYLDPVIDRFKLKVCLDMGHILRYGYDLEQTFDRHRDRIAVIHLHGVDMSGTSYRDHLSLEQLPGNVLHRVVALLCQYTGVVSIEVFSREKLEGCLKVLEQQFSGLDHITLM